MNDLLARGEIEREDMWPRIAEYESKAAPFLFEFGLDELPREPGVIGVRGPRQYGKSTWLDIELRATVGTFGKGTAYYLKRGKAGPLNFRWFPSAFPRKRLTVICTTPFETDHVRGVSLHDFLMAGPSRLAK